MKKKKVCQEFRKELIKALDSTLEIQLNRVKDSVEKGLIYSSDRDGDMELLVKAGFLKYSGNMGSMLHSQHTYEITEKGKEFYTYVFEKNMARKKKADKKIESTEERNYEDFCGDNDNWPGPTFGMCDPSDEDDDYSLGGAGPR